MKHCHGYSCWSRHIRGFDLNRTHADSGKMEKAINNVTERVGKECMYT